MKIETKLQFPMFTNESEWTAPTELPDLSGASEIAVDLETCDPNLKNAGPGWPTGNGKVVGVAIAVDGWKGYLPFEHLGGGNLDKRIALNWVKKQMALDCPKIMHNAQYDAGWLRQLGIPVNGKLIDTMVMGSLLDENRFSFSLNALAFDYLGKAKSEKLLTAAAVDFGVDPKAELWKLPAAFVGPYAEQDAVLALELYNFFKVKIQTDNLSNVFDLETRLTPCLIDMTWRGIRIDIDRVEKTKQLILKQEKEVLKEIKRMSGLNVEIWAAASISKAFDKVGITYPKTEKGAPSFTKSFLTEHPHEFPRLIVKARGLNKTQGTFLNTILRHMGDDGRIHSHINQIRSDDGGTVSGRISMNSPNLQQIPARDPVIGPMIRSLFLPEEGQQWAAIDFSQQEPRILVHFAKNYATYKKQKSTSIDEFVDGYQNNPKMDFHSMVADMAKIPRKQAKTINLGMMYGMGIGKLSEQLDVSFDEAKALTQQYHSRVPFVKELMSGVALAVDNNRNDGSVRSLGGRKCRFNQWEPRSYGINKALPLEQALAAYGPTTSLKRAYTYKALNRLIQASAADMTKQAMVNVYESGELPLVQVHDELGCSVRDADHAKRIAGLMESAIPLNVPNRCDIEMGPNWGEAVEIDHT
jgi:DNA polymerase I-like protein with 3'-5' exonuclease and polymerase domains